MDWKSLILKIRHEGPWRGGRRVLSRQLRRFHIRRRRTRWSQPDPSISVEAIPDNFSFEPTEGDETDCAFSEAVLPGA